MKKRYRTLFALFAGALFLSLAAGVGQAANTDKGSQALHRDGSAFVKESTVLQADRQDAADRARAKGFGVSKRDGSVNSDKITPTDGGAKK